MSDPKRPVPLEVTEWMRGFIGLEAHDYDGGFIAGIDGGGRFEHEVRIRIADIDRFATDPRHEARLEGKLTCPALGGTFAVEDGVFRMLVDAQTPGLKFMRYFMPYREPSGRLRTVVGHKTVHDDRSLDAWADTTTLFVDVCEGPVAVDGPAPPPVARGTIHIEKLDLIRSIRSFRSPGATVAEAAHARARFAGFLFGKLWDVYGPRL
jgi:uncharacterized protein YbaR (Trm112 family)